MFFRSSRRGSGGGGGGGGGASAAQQRTSGVTGVHGTLFYTGQTPFGGSSSSGSATTTSTTAATTTPSAAMTTVASSHAQRHRFERPSSAPGGGGGAAVALANSLLGYGGSVGHSSNTTAVSPRSTLFGASSDTASLHSTVGNSNSSNNGSADVLSHVEQRLKIIKRSRVSRRGSGGKVDGAATSPSWTRVAAHVDEDEDKESSSGAMMARTTATVRQRATPPPCAAYPSYHAGKLSKHEQHVLDAAAAQCLDALLFPMTS